MTIKSKNKKTNVHTKVRAISKNVMTLKIMVSSPMVSSQKYILVSVFYFFFYIKPSSTTQAWDFKKKLKKFAEFYDLFV